MYAHVCACVCIYVIVIAHLSLCIELCSSYCHYYRSKEDVDGVKDVLKFALQVLVHTQWHV